ncbi:MAG TPA: TPM domain-containing protein [Thermoanaerobaculia bacterium]|nr:TPM domain-containing protein [Thermoanaerobaculia bacterium]
MRSRRERPERPALAVAALGLALLVAVLLAAAPAAAREVPFLSGRVVDEANLLSPGARQRIEARLAAYERQTGRQVAVLVIDSLEGEVLEDYANRVGRTWALGRAEEDDGVLFLVVAGERKMRIEVGYGAEPELTDLESSRILTEQVAPRFRTGDFDGGVEAGVASILAHLGVGEEPPPPDTGGFGDVPAGLRLLGMLLFTAVVGTFSAVAVSSRGCMGWFLWVFLLPFYVAFPSALVHPYAGMGLGLLWLVGFPVLRWWVGRNGPPGGGPLRRSGGRGGGWLGPVVWTGGLGRGGRGGGFGGGGFGGFTGGGGSFGGGGASGSW